ncbi:hypothetical protein [uncultured Amphritea sp.]|uniref:hypothetical protein n=1 Tax=uncultured Amphritea sp. TaxID=981605 RepID=UPI00261290F6|nr:hypothetical protein [uncultured Amphritea sp.]
MFEDTELGQKVAGAKTWRQLFAAVYAAREVNTPDGAGLYFSNWRICNPEKAALRIHRIRDGELGLQHITRNYGLRMKVSELMNPPVGEVGECGMQLGFDQWPSEVRVVYRNDNCCLHVGSITNLTSIPVFIERKTFELSEADRCMIAGYIDQLCC